MMLQPQEGGVEVLRAMAEKVESGHEQDDIEEASGVFAQHSDDTGVLPGSGLGQECRRFPDLAANIDNKKRGQRARDEHPAPADQAIKSEISNRGEKIPARIARLQKP